MQLGQLEIFLVSDGVMHSDAGGVYGLVPRALWSKVTPPDDQNRVPATLNCLLVISREQKILIDTGLGNKLDAKAESNFGRTGGSQLLAELQKLGVAPNAIDLVINTHLHADHCGGNTVGERNQFAPTFPRAQYAIQRLELADAMYPNERTRATYLAENFAPLGERVRLLDGDTRINDTVRCMITRGHTRAHQSVLIESDGQRALFLGDAIGRAVYFERMAWIPAFDVEPLETLETKRRLRDWVIEDKVLLIFQHDHLTTMGYLKKDGDKYRVEKVS